MRCACRARLRARTTVFFALPPFVFNGVMGFPSTGKGRRRWAYFAWLLMRTTAPMFSLLQSVYPNIWSAFTFRSKAEPPLYPLLCSREVLGAASYFVLADMLADCSPRPQAAAVERREPAFLGSLQEELQDRCYRPGPVARVMKGPFDHPRRHLTFVKDRIVHTALLLILESALGEVCPECPEKMNTLAALCTTVRRGSHDFEAFDLGGRDARRGVSCQTLFRLVVAHVHDDDIRCLLKLFLKAPVVEVRECEWGHAQ